jgi:ribonuclease R
VRTAVLRSMKRAVYSAEFSGHFGLAKKHYAHFTSPIRRYPDLVVHRQLASWLERGEPGSGEGKPRRGAPRLDRGSLMPIAEHCSSTEQIAEEAERTLEEIKKYRFLEEQVAQGKPLVYEAAVAAVTNFGMFVELIDLQIQGLVHVSAISDRFVRHDRGRNELRSGKQVFGVGVKVNVKVVKVDFDKRRVDFVLA